MIGGAHSEVVAVVVDRLVRRKRQGIEGIGDVAGIVGVERKLAALLDNRAGEGIVEPSSRQRDDGRCAAAFLAGVVMGHQSQENIAPGPGMGGQVAGGLATAGARSQLGQR